LSIVKNAKRSTANPPPRRALWGKRPSVGFLYIQAAPADGYSGDGA
jgi:hypothetical protein